MLLGSKHEIDNCFSIIESDVACLPENSLVLVAGDANARCGLLKDYISDSFTTHEFQAPSVNSLDNIVISNLLSNDKLQRTSCDTTINTFGKNLIELCIASSSLIFNGRCSKENNDSGQFTFQNSKGESLIDYFIGSPRLLPLATMEVLPKFPESDHKPICLSIKCNISFGDAPVIPRVSSWSKLEKYKWKTCDLPLFTVALNDLDSLLVLDTFFDSIAMLKPSEDVANAFSKYVHYAASKM